MNNNTLKTIGKYAVILSILYTIEVFLGLFMKHFIVNIISDNFLKSILLLIPAGVLLAFNIVTAIVIYKDIKRLEVNAKYSILLTVFFRPLGVVIFLIYLMNKELSENVVHNEV